MGRTYHAPGGGNNAMWDHPDAAGRLVARGNPVR